MTCAIGGSFLLGLLIGCRYAAPALLAASLVVAGGTVAAGLIAGWPLGRVGLSVLGSLASLQCGYLAALGAASYQIARSRSGAAPPRRAGGPRR